MKIGNCKIKNSNRGFTLVEFIITLAIIVVMATVSLLGLSGYRGRQNISLSVDEVVAVVRDTQNRSLTQEDGQSWGIRFNNAENDEYKVFKGSSYASGTVERIYSFRRGISFSEPPENFYADIVFNALTGKPNFSKIISLVSKSGQNIVGDIIINASGLITDRVEDGLVGYWHFDEGTSTVAYDASGKGNTGTLINGPTWQMALNCKVGKCLSFNGTDKYVNIPNSSWLQVAGDMTLNVWVYPTNCAIGRQGILYKTYNNEFEIILEPSCAVSFYQGNGTWEEIQEPSGFNAPQNTWTHLAVVRTTNNKTLSFYKNGVLVGTDVYVNAPTVSIKPVIIGKRDGTTYYFNGLIDEVRIYNKALTAKEIAAIYNATK